MLALTSAVLASYFAVAVAGQEPSSIAQPNVLFVEDFESGATCGVWSRVVTQEVCNGRDDDCDLAIDEDVTNCFSAPHQQPVFPQTIVEEFATAATKLDVYLLIDRSNTMSVEINVIRNGIASVADNVTCMPEGDGAPGNCFPDIWWGAGGIGYTGSEGESYTNVLDLQPEASLLSTAIPTTEPPGCCDEPILLATWSTVTGLGTSASGCTLSAAYPDGGACASSPAGAAGVGYPCFRSDAHPVIVLVTDEAPTQTFNCPVLTTVIASANSVGAKIVGIEGNSTDPQLTTDLVTLANGTGAIDGDGLPLVFDGADFNAAAAIQNALQSLPIGGTLDLSVELLDDPSDAVDAVAAFIDSIETYQPATAQCPDGLATTDSDGDGLDDTYVGVPTGSPVCWLVNAKDNLSVPATSEPQTFAVTLKVVADGSAQLMALDLTFVVPAAP